MRHLDLWKYSALNNWKELKALLPEKNINIPFFKDIVTSC